MKIEVERVKRENAIEFIIKVTDPHGVPFTLEEAHTLRAVEQFNSTMSAALNPASKLYHDIVCATHEVKEKMVCRVLESLKSSIMDDLESQFKPICQEIFNWLYDNQEEHAKSWLSAFYPERVTYYFANDLKMKEQNTKSDTDYEEDEDDETDY
jgi:hypothetical protein